MKKVSELILACEHLLVFLHANVEQELEQVEQEVVEELAVQVEEVEETINEVVEEIEDSIEEVEEPKAATDLDFLKDTPTRIEKPFKPTKDMNYKELREYYKKLRGN